MEDKNILFLDAGSDSELKLNFSLHLAGFRVLSFRTFDEAVNWGATCSCPEETLCLLVNANGAGRGVKEQMRLFRDRAAHLPVVWVETEAGRGPELCDIPNLLVCSPEDVPATLRRLQEEPAPHKPHH